jgi:uncharacterized membrane protein
MFPGLLWSLPITALWIACGFAGRRWIPARQERSVAAGIVVGLIVLLVATTFEVARVAGTLTSDATIRSGSVSIWWALVATGLLLFGFVRRRAEARYAGIALLLAATGKVLTWDLSQVSPAVRVGCFIALGLVLLGVAAQYLRASGARPSADAGAGDEEPGSNAG